VAGGRAAFRDAAQLRARHDRARDRRGCTPAWFRAMPWNVDNWDTLYELDEDGRLWYREGRITVPRQSSKTTSTLVRQTHRVTQTDTRGVTARSARSPCSTRRRAHEDGEEWMPIVESRRRSTTTKAKRHGKWAGRTVTNTCGTSRPAVASSPSTERERRAWWRARPRRHRRGVCASRRPRRAGIAAGHDYA